jgi:hypothetical protein
MLMFNMQPGALPRDVLSQARTQYGAMADPPAGEAKESPHLQVSLRQSSSGFHHEVSSYLIRS